MQFFIDSVNIFSRRSMTRRFYTKVTKRKGVTRNWTILEQTFACTQGVLGKSLGKFAPLDLSTETLN